MSIQEKIKITYAMKNFCCLAILSVSINVSAAGFDCSKAATSVEHMICDNKVLSNLDSAMSNLYYSKKDSNLKEVQLDWVKTKRNNAQSVDELSTLYAEHIQFLSEYTTKINEHNIENKPVEASKPVNEENNSSGRLKLSDFENEFINFDGMEYSTRYKEMNKSNYVLLCADVMMIDLMNGWRKDSAKKNQSGEFSRLRGNLYNGLWNMTVDNIESKVNTREMRMICDMLNAGNR
jgi:uncharacterized protein